MPNHGDSAAGTGDLIPEPSGDEPRVLQPGQWVGTYRVTRLIGVGGMGRVYLARDATLDRPVALKFVRGAVEPDTLLREAKALARLTNPTHPNIVTVHASGEHEGEIYLALEYLDGETLTDLIVGGALPKGRALRIGLQIADALRHAHDKQILHCDLKPDNVLMPKDGRPRVVDFGLARNLSNANERHRGGTLGYMPPEQIRGDELGRPADIWALGVVLFETLTRRRPEPLEGTALAAADRAELERRQVPAAVVRLIERMLCPATRGRPSAAEVTQILTHEVAPARIDVDDEERPVFRGLAPFEEADVGRFFGREDEVEAIVEQLRHRPTLALAGRSGVGKSSLVSAGVIPRLREEGAWRVISLRPGPRPFEALAQAILRSDSPGEADDQAAGEALAAQLRARPGTLTLRLLALADRSNGHAVGEGLRVLLVIEQLEEVHTLAADPESSQDFLRLVAQTLSDPHEPLRALLTVRDDFAGRTTGLDHIRVIEPMTADNLRQALVRPLAQAGYRFESEDTVTAMLEELAEEPAALPLMQFTATALWAARDKERRVLTQASYVELGGVAGALSAEAQRVLANLSDESTATLRRLLLRLVSDEGTRRPLSEEEALSGLGPTARPVLDRLVQARVVSQYRARDGTGETRIELAHESLIKTWQALVEWLDQSREERRLARRLEREARTWDELGRRDNELWPKEDILQVEAKLSAQIDHLPNLARTFFAASQRRVRTTQRRRRGVAIAVMVLSIALGIVGGAFALEFRRREAIATQALANVGQFDLVLEPFDWSPEALEILPADAGPPGAIRWALRRGGPSETNPGPVLAAPEVEYKPSPLRNRWPGAAVVRVQTKAGPAFLDIIRPAHEGRACAPSRVRLAALPGYATRDEPSVIRVPFPSCQATWAGFRAIPAGRFTFGGRGDSDLDPEEVDKEALEELGTYWIDETEVPNAQYRPFAELSSITGYGRPLYTQAQFLASSGKDEYPATGMDLHSAAAFCAYFGKRLPTEKEWVKAARGGWWLDAGATVRNPAPERILPWEGPDGPHRNLEGVEDGYDGMSPIRAFPAGRSPYGLYGMAGNVMEWTSSPSLEFPGLFIVRGAGWDTPAELNLHSTVIGNIREARFFAYDIGLRCVADSGAAI